MNYVIEYIYDVNLYLKGKCEFKAIFVKSSKQNYFKKISKNATIYTFFQLNNLICYKQLKEVTYCQVRLEKSKSD